uniref:Uncharacterized protein n=1 Tax=Arundo donax TaxID=35708 RepID=A0A0A9F0M8_ARUDO
MVGMKLLLPVSTDESPNTMIAGTFVPAATAPPPPRCSKKKIINNGKYLWSDIASRPNNTSRERRRRKSQDYKRTRYSYLVRCM